MWAIVAGVFVLWLIGKALQHNSGPYTPMSSDKIEELKQKGVLMSSREYEYKKYEEEQAHKLKEWWK